MVEITTKLRYAPTAAIAGLSLFHHHTAVVPNHTPETTRTREKDPIKAQGVSPPVRSRPSRKKRFREGCFFQRRRGLPVAESITGIARRGGETSGGVGMKEGRGEDEDEEVEVVALGWCNDCFRSSYLSNDIPRFMPNILSRLVLTSRVALRAGESGAFDVDGD